MCCKYFGKSLILSSLAFVLALGSLYLYSTIRSSIKDKLVSNIENNLELNRNISESENVKYCRPMKNPAEITSLDQNYAALLNKKTAFKREMENNQGSLTVKQNLQIRLLQTEKEIEMTKKWRKQSEELKSALYSETNGIQNLLYFQKCY